MTKQAIGDYNKLVELGRALLPGQSHEITRIRDATVYLIRAAPTNSDFDIHEELDEFVVVLDGVFRVEMPDGDAEVKAGESLLVPRGTPHRARLTTEAIILLIR
jgi:mannose-6-phosphate isomerase-like protein (cupin superfamily)